jgi:uncharacterized DUF497 family protein
VGTVSFGDLEWDADKAVANAAKRGVTFEEAVAVFLDLHYMLIRDTLHPDRFVAIGLSTGADPLRRALRTWREAPDHQCSTR